MDTLSLVSKYLNGLEDYLDDGDFLEAKKLTVGKSAWDAELDMADSFNYIMEERFDMLGFVRVDYGKYRRKTVKEVRMEIHGFTFLVDFVMIGYANKGDPLVIFGRDFLLTSKSRVDFGIGEMRIDLTMLEEMKDIDVMLDCLVEEVGRTRLSGEEYGKEEKMRIVEHGLPKKICDPGNFVLQFELMKR
ncbi:hypothetical protein Tco_1008232 [Tanacetum coccineum]